MRKVTTILATISLIIITLTPAQALDNNLSQPSKLCLSKMTEIDEALFIIADAYNTEDFEMLDVLVPEFLKNSRIAIENCPSRFVSDIHNIRNSVKNEYLELQKKELK